MTEGAFTVGLNNAVNKHLDQDARASIGAHPDLGSVVGAAILGTRWMVDVFAALGYRDLIEIHGKPVQRGPDFGAA